MRFEPYADYLQFRIQDAEAEEGFPDWDAWTGSNSAEPRIAPGTHAIAVATARYDYVPVTLRLLPEPPPDAARDAFHVVEADIELPSGKLAITGCTEMPGEVTPVEVSPGRYRTRISCLPAGHRPSRSNDSEPGDYLEYQVAMWPVQQAVDIIVLKQGDKVWAG